MFIVNAMICSTVESREVKTRHEMYDYISFLKNIQDCTHIVAGYVTKVEYIWSRYSKPQEIVNEFPKGGE